MPHNSEETMTIGRKISLEMKPSNISSKKSYRRILKLNFYDVDKIKTLKYIRCVRVTEEDYSQIDLIIKFCEVTFLQIDLYVKYPIPDKIIKKLNRHDINYTIYNN
jgi:hypothetical protein